MLTLEDPKTRALVLFRAFSLEACRHFVAFLDDPPPGEKEHLIEDIEMAVATLRFFGRHVDQFFPRPGDLDRLAADQQMQATIQKLQPVYEQCDPDRRLRNDRRYWPAVVGHAWFSRAIMPLDEVLAYCSEEVTGGTVSLVCYITRILESVVSSSVPGPIHSPYEQPDAVGRFVRQYMRIADRDEWDDDDGSDDTDTDDADDDTNAGGNGGPPANAAPTIDANATPATPAAPTIRFREFL
jgi:hypothetical protein